jgi:hypothetical protein
MNNDRRSRRWSNNAEDKRRVEKQRLRNNILGIFVLLLMFFLALDIGGCSSMLSNFLLQQ